MQLKYLINNCIQHYKDNNIKSGDRVVYCGNNSVEWVAWNLSCYMVGGIWVPMYKNQSANYYNHIIEDCDPKLLIRENETNLQLENTKLQQISNKVTEEINYNYENFTICHDDIATLIYSSGTTGKPKGVKLSHHNILSNINAIEHRFNNVKNVKSLNVLPWAHIYGLTCELYYNLFNNNETYICSDRLKFIDECKEVKPDTIYIVPKILELIKSKTEKFDKPVIRFVLPYIIKHLFGNNLKLVFTGGSKLDDTVKDFYEKNGITICEGYGCSETSPIISLNHNVFPRVTKSVGRLLHNVDVEIINDEICVSGPSVMEGYWNNKDKTDEVLFTDKNNKKWYKTGDSGYIDSGYLYYKGRLSENYKLSNGKFVNVGEVEAIIKKYVNGNFVVFTKDGKDNSIISDTQISDHILTKINSDLDKYLKIKNIFLINQEEMSNFMTPKMSIKRQKLINYIKNNLYIK
uniref:Long-Chain Fatty Acid--Coa Ligase n=1 Tax=Florenciella sp. virus SA2 TaxID=3240092 RepID=A0AB39J7Q0_9VIRU